MQIDKIQNLNFSLNKKVKNNKTQKNTNIQQSYYPKIDAKYYRANSNINFCGANEEKKLFPMPLIKDDEIVGYIFPIKITKNLSNNLEISKEFFNDFLCDKNGKFQPGVFKKYIDTFKGKLLTELRGEIDLRNYLINSLKEEQADISEYIDNDELLFLSGEEIEELIDEHFKEDQEKLTDVILQNLNAKTDSDEEFVKNVFAGTPKGPLKIFMAKRMLERLTPEIMIKNSFETSQKNTDAFFKLSATKDGFDFLNIEQKNKVANLVKDYERNYNTENAIDEIIQATIATRGKIDLDFIELYTTILRMTEGLPKDFSILKSLEHVNEIAMFGDLKDKEFTEFVLHFANKDCPNEKDVEIFKLLVDLSVNKIDNKLSEKYKVAEKATTKWIVKECEALEETLPRELMATVDNYYFENAKYKILNEYLGYVKNSDNPIEIEKFLALYGSKYKFENQ